MKEPSQSDAESSKEPTPTANVSPADDGPSREPPQESSRDDAPAAAPTPTRGFLGLPLWLLIISAVLSLELFIYGHDGWVRVCVGMDHVTDLSALDRPRERDSIRGYPLCAEQLNLGMYSRSEDAAQEALDVACSRGATLLRGNKSDCLRREHGWIRRVDKANIPPWDPRLYRRLLFLD